LSNDLTDVKTEFNSLLNDLRNSEKLIKEKENKTKELNKEFKNKEKIYEDKLKSKDKQFEHKMLIELKNKDEDINKIKLE